jgi:alkanesulfonate monooxygenase SsuD/methylene tetrahydromethanopterin reductase-like flavin-dependent oxidoreductase (luciferase family)
MIPTFDGASWPEIRGAAERAEQVGLDSIWISDQLVMRTGEGDRGIHEAWTMTSAVAALTRRVLVGQLVLCAVFRNPALVAKMAATLDAVAPGRVILGVGAGNWPDPEYEAFGYPHDRLASRFEEWVEILARLLREHRLTYAGRFYRVGDAVLVPPPEHPIPLLIAARRPRMLAHLATWADQWNGAWYGLTLDGLDADLRALDGALAVAGRDPASIARTIGIVLGDPDPDCADPAFARLNPPRGVDDIARVLVELERRGVDHAIAWPLSPGVEPIERLAEAARVAFG